MPELEDEGEREPQPIEVQMKSGELWRVGTLNGARVRWLCVYRSRETPQVVETVDLSVARYRWPLGSQ